jgi:integrase
MPKKKLTEEGVARLKPPRTGQVDYFDDYLPGLILRVNYGGKKSWKALHYLKRLDRNGKRVSIPTTHTLGRYPVLKLKEAREKARQFLADPQKGLAQASAGSFGEVADEYLKRHVEAKKLRTEPEIRRMLDKLVLPAWQGRAFRELKRSDVIALLDGIADKNGARTADLVLAVIRSMCNWYQSRNDDYVSPIVRGMARSKPAERARRRILDDDEIRAMWTASADLGTFGAILKILLLTGQRRDKVVTMKWEDVVDGEWRIATAPREKSNPGSLRLPPLALDIIAAQPRILGTDYIFAGQGGGPFAAYHHYKKKIDAKLPEGTPGWTIHDLRRTARSLLSRAGVRPDLAERVLGHTITGVEGVYDRHQYGDEKADALVKLAALIERIVNPPAANVVDIRSARMEAVAD